MQDRWYGDNRDLVKWGVLFRLAELFDAQHILQIAFYRPSTFDPITIDGKERDLPAEVISHFRDVRRITGINSRVRVTLFDVEFRDRESYLQAALAQIRVFAQERCIVFLDPDTGLQPQQAFGLEHVRDAEVRQVWDAMKEGDVFVFYQHQTNRAGQEWKTPKRTQLAEALDLQPGTVRVAEAPKIARDVVFFFLRKARQEPRS